MEQKRNPIIKGDVLTLGQQAVFCSLADIKSILAFHGLPIKDLPFGFDTASKITGWKGTPYESNPNAQTLLTLLGADHVYAADISTFENPDFIINLNEPVDVSYHERFDTIVDVGTLEHVFDVATALKNIVKMCRRGGSIILVNPSSGAPDHGFYQFSPTLYFDYFGSNGFSVVSCYLNEPLRYCPIDRRKGRIFRYEYVDDEIPFVSSTGFDVAFFATKNTLDDTDGGVTPVQSLYSNIYRKIYRDIWNAAKDESPTADEAVYRSINRNSSNAAKNDSPPFDEAERTNSTPWWRFRKAAKRVWLMAGIPIPTNEWARLILSFSFITVLRRVVWILLDRTTTWHPLWLNRYMFRRGRGKNIRFIATYSASGDLQLRQPNRRL